jgi:Family of unknown function (DUF6092)
MASPAESARPEDPVFELVAFLVSGARGAPEEGVYTASLRLVEAAGRLSRIATANAGNPFLSELGEVISKNASTKYMESTESYLAFLDEILASVAREIRRRNGLEP